LKRERGWLSIVTRDELTPGEYRIGSAPDNNVVLPKALAPAHLGTIIVSPGKARLVLAKGQQMRIVAKDDLGEEFTARDLVTGATNLEWVTAGRLSLQFVKREDGKIVVRAADRESPRRKTFAGRVWYEPRPSSRFPRASCRAPRAQRFRSPMCGARSAMKKWRARSNSVLNGRKMSLDALDDDGDLFIIFRDATSNSTTYPPGRFLAVEKPKDGAWSSTSTRHTTRLARFPPIRPARCRRRRTGSPTTCRRREIRGPEVLKRISRRLARGASLARWS
jgi:uncharacterized protein (DUF1684 family)